MRRTEAGLTSTITFQAVRPRNWVRFAGTRGGVPRTCPQFFGQIADTGRANDRHGINNTLTDPFTRRPAP